MLGFLMEKIMKKIWSVGALGIGLLVSYTANASVELQFPEGISILTVNMKKPDVDGGLLDKTKSLTLPDGVNQIVFQYTQDFLDHDDYKKAYSDIIIARFSASEDKIKMVLPEFDSYAVAKKKMPNLAWHLQSVNSGKDIKKVADKLSIDGLRFGRNYANDAEEYNKKGGKAAVAMTYITTDNTGKVVSSQSVKGSGQVLPGDNLSTLKRVYKSASVEDRKAFQKWIIDQK
ncbi:DUF2057 domain-containing protein [Vibrio sp. CAIM 722]|uniref:DUF2057 domain-containing protein n=2 Tax=Vibrio eleionomae TaxID=2653505 RepID=A0A7X4LIY0_9VIBR|nr:DUF2057 domain-containing protein [Vibrio eleionomae]